MLTNFAEQTTRMISINFGFGPPLMVETCFEVAEPDKTLVEVEPVGCFNHLYQLTRPGASLASATVETPERMWSSRWRRRDYHRWKLGKCLRFHKRKMVQMRGELFGWLDGYPFWERSHNNPLPPAPAQVGYMCFHGSLRRKKYLDLDSQKGDSY